MVRGWGWGQLFDGWVVGWVTFVVTPLYPLWGPLSHLPTRCTLPVPLRFCRAHLCGDAALCKLFNSSGDVYYSLASHVCGVPIHAVTPEQRKQAKVVSLGILYGIGVQEVSKQLAVDAATCVASHVAASNGVCPLPPPPFPMPPLPQSCDPCVALGGD